MVSWVLLRQRRQKWGGRVRPTESFCVCKPGWRWHQLHIRQFPPLAVDWKCPVGVYETHLDKGTLWLQDGTVLSVEVFKN